MNAHEEKELWSRCKEQHDADAREKLIIEYMRVVRYIAGRMAIHVPSTVDMDDLISWGVLGLIDAVEKYDHQQAIKFSTYASIRVRGAILDEIRSLDWAPRSLRAMARKIGTARDQLRHELGCEPSSEDIARTLEISEDQVDDVISQLQTAHILALDDYLPSEDEHENRKIHLTNDATIQSPEAYAEEQERVDQLVETILKLPDQQQKVLNLYYYEQLTLKEIGAVLEVSESRVCQIHSAAMKKLRKAVHGGA